ncbi:MAG: PQQ-dependent sugar dehydrogenase [Steroidobacteraceae bacterium]
MTWALALPLLLVVGLYAYARYGTPRIGDLRAAVAAVIGHDTATPAGEIDLSRFHAAPGWTVTLYADELPTARWLLATPAGDLLLARSQSGAVELLARDANGDGHPDGRRTLLEKLDRPHGLAIRDGWLYVAEKTAVGRVRYDEATGTTSGPYEHLITGLTGDGNHVTRTIAFGPDGRLYLSQGSTCNVCIEQDPRRATMMVFDADGSNGRIYATGLRNSVGFDWAPWDGALYATENARDLLGDEFPPDELNRVVDGGFYGWPYFSGNNVRDPDFGDRVPPALAAAARVPAHGFRAHNAPLGLVFLRSPARPPGYERAAIAALHGSWNRSVPDGYKVVSLHWDSDGQIVERDFLTGFRSDGDLIGRPAGVAEGPDGSVYVADDYAGVVYRVSPAAAAR